MNPKSVFDFVELDRFYGFFSPLTPYGLDSRARKEVFTDGSALDEQYRLTELSSDFIVRDPARADRLEFHLRRIPRLPSLGSRFFDAADLFLVKKFLMNFKAAAELLPPGMAGNLEVGFVSPELLSALLKSGGDETFHLADAFHPGLSEARKAIGRIDAQMTEAKKSRVSEILEITGLDFRFRDFIVLADWARAGLEPGLVYAEPYDGAHMLVKPVMPEVYYTLISEKESLLEREKQLVREVLEDLSSQVRAEAARLAEYESMVERTDVFMARARLALRFSMTRPRFLDASAGTGISVVNGRFIPQDMKCEDLGIPYTPLTVGFESRVAVIRGSNMGGKTVLLKSLGFFQVLAQMGFFVPAESFASVVFDSLFYIGESAGAEIRGLSSFGLEIHEFVESCNRRGSGPALYLVDEFARTTGSREAAALIVAALQDFSDRPKTYCFMSTHFMELPKFGQVSFYRMKGLDHEIFERTCRQGSKSIASPASEGNRSLPGIADSLIGRIRAINRFMRYEVVPDRDGTVTSDALKIAGVLGLDDRTHGTACEYLEGKWKRN